MKRTGAQTDASFVSERSQSFGSLKPGMKSMIKAREPSFLKENNESKITLTSASIAAKPVKGILKQSKITPQYNTINPSSGAAARGGSAQRANAQANQPSVFYGTGLSNQHQFSNNDAATQAVSTAENILAHYESHKISLQKVQPITQYMSMYTPGGASKMAQISSNHNFYSANYKQSTSNRDICQYLNQLETNVLRPTAHQERQIRISRVLQQEKAQSIRHRISSESSVSESSESEQSSDDSREHRRRERRRRRREKEKKKSSRRQKEQQNYESNSPEQQKQYPSQMRQSRGELQQSSGKESVFLMQQIFCVVCEDYIEVSKVNEHSKYCQETGQQQMQQQHQSQHKSNLSRSKNKVSELQYSLEKVNQKLLKVKIFLEEVRVRSDLQNYSRIESYLSYIVQTALKLLSSAGLKEFSEYQLDLSILIKKVSETQTNSNSHVVLSIVALADRLAEFATIKVELLEDLQNYRGSDEVIPFHEHDGQSDESQSIPSRRSFPNQQQQSHTQQKVHRAIFTGNDVKRS